MRTYKAGTATRSGQSAFDSALQLSRMPLEWLDGSSWRLPSGQALAEFALQAGFLAPLLLKGEGLMRLKARSARARKNAPAKSVVGSSRRAGDL